MSPFVFIIMVISTSISHHPSIHPHTSLRPPSTRTRPTKSTSFKFSSFPLHSPSPPHTHIHTHSFFQLMNISLPSLLSAPSGLPPTVHCFPFHCFPALHSPAPRKTKIRSQVLQLFKIQQEREKSYSKSSKRESNCSLCICLGAACVGRMAMNVYNKLTLREEQATQRKGVVVTRTWMRK